MTKIILTPDELLMFSIAERLRALDALAQGDIVNYHALEQTADQAAGLAQRVADRPAS